MMNKRLLLVLCYEIFLFKAFGQYFDAGVRLGMTASQISGDHLAGFNKPGLTGGVFVALAYKNNYFFRLEMNYIEKGSMGLAHPDKGIYDSYKLRLNYLEVPILFGYQYQEKYSVSAGLSIGYLIRSKEEDQNGLISRPDEFPRFTEFEFGAIGAFSYQLNPKWSVGAEMGYSILPVRKHQGGAVYRLNRGQYNNAIMLVVKYHFKKPE